MLEDISVCVDDWRPMTERLDKILADLSSHPPELPAAELDEGIEFLRWIGDDHFTFLGYREYELVEKDEWRCRNLHTA